MNVRTHLIPVSYSEKLRRRIGSWDCRSHNKRLAIDDRNVASHWKNIDGNLGIPLYFVTYKYSSLQKWGKDLSNVGDADLRQGFCRIQQNIAQLIHKDVHSKEELFYYSVAPPTTKEIEDR